jgi:serine/threonine-protein kinase TTK/MPS1
LIGKGGLSKVYRVRSPTGHILAIKRVKLQGVDSSSAAGYLSEVDLLREFARKGFKRVVRMFDSQLDESTGALLMVMECGEGDLSKVLHTKPGTMLPLDVVRFYWRQVRTIGDVRLILLAGLLFF